jgi:hypothetical protein
VTGIVPDRVAGRDARDELTIRVFRPLYQQFDLRTVGGTHIAVPRGTPWFAGISLAASRGRSARTSRADPAAAQTRPARTSEDGTPRP